MFALFGWLVQKWHSWFHYIPTDTGDDSDG